MQLKEKSSGWSSPVRWRRALAILAGASLVGLLFCGAAALQRVGARPSSAGAFDSGDLYNFTNVWTVHLKFTADQWDAMEPKGGGSPFGGGRQGGGRAPNGDRTLAPVIMSRGDFDRDGRISRREFGRLAEDLFKNWDTNRAGKLDGDQIRAGLDNIRNPAGGGISTMLLAEEGKRNGIGAALGYDFEYVHADLEFEDRLFRNVGVRHKGNGTFMESRDSLKRPLKIDLNYYAKGQSLGRITTLNLQNNVTDASLMNEVLAYRLYRDAGVPAPRTAYARVFVTVPGKHERKYLGIYSMSEAVDKEFAGRQFGTKRGAIFKPVTPSLFTDLGADWSAYNQIYDPKGGLYDEQKKAVMELSRFVTHADDEAFAARIGEFIDLPEFARFMAVMVYLSDLDGILGPGQNLYLHLHPKNQQFQFIPWDQDRSWGQFNRASQEQRDKLSIQRPWQGGNFFLERMFRVEAFKKLYLARLEEFSRTIFAPERVARQVDEIAGVIRTAVQEESDSKLERFEKVVAGESLSSGGGFGGGQTKPIKPFTQARSQSVLDQLLGKSEGLVAGSGFPGGGGGSGLGMFSRPLVEALDRNKDTAVTPAEFMDGFSGLFKSWNTNGSGYLTLAQVRAGIQKDLPPQQRGFSPSGGRSRGPGAAGANAPGPSGPTAAATAGVTGTSDPALFTSEHWGMDAFTWKLPNGKYMAKLYFAETYDGITGPGQRVFSFNVHGREFKDFDIWTKAGGRNRAYVETLPVEVTNGAFRITFTRQVENPAIKAIEVIPQTEATGGAGTPAAVRINAGAAAAFTDSRGQVWQADTGFEGGMTNPGMGSFGGAPPMNQGLRGPNSSDRESRP